MLKPGDQAPDFNVKDDQGRDVALKSLRGKNVVLWFYPEADTPGCTAEGCSFRDLKSEFEKKNAAIYGVSFNNPEQNSAFSKKFGFNFPLLCDTERKLGIAYGACDEPSAKSARRIGVIIDPEGKVREYVPKANAKTFASEALEKI